MIFNENAIKQLLMNLLFMMVLVPSMKAWILIFLYNIQNQLFQLGGGEMGMDSHLGYSELKFSVYCLLKCFEVFFSTLSS